MAGHNLPQDFKEFLKLLNESGVEYLLIGGYAVGYHGYTNRLNYATLLRDLNRLNKEFEEHLKGLRREAQSFRDPALLGTNTPLKAK